MQSSGFVEANGARLFYEMKGEGQPLVLIHSGLLDSRMWDAQMEAFSKTHRVICYDVRGHGQSSDVTEPYEDTEDLLALLNALGVVQASVLGLSMGGRIAVDFTIAHPERVTKLVLAAPAISGYPGDEDDQQDISMVKSMEAVGYIVQCERSKAVDVLMNEHPMWYLSHEADRQRLRNWFGVSRFSSWVQSHNVKQLEPPAYHRLGEIQVPTLLMIGDLDTVTMQKIARHYEAGIAGCQREVIEGAAHLPNIEEPELFTRLTEDFLQR